MKDFPSNKIQELFEKLSGMQPNNRCPSCGLFINTDLKKCPKCGRVVCENCIGCDGSDCMVCGFSGLEKDVSEVKHEFSR